MTTRPFNIGDKDVGVFTTRLRVSFVRTTSWALVEFLPAWYFFQCGLPSEFGSLPSCEHLVPHCDSRDGCRALPRRTSVHSDNGHHRHQHPGAVRMDST
jgi:hypothetical protein